MHTDASGGKPVTQFENRILLSANESSAAREFLRILSSRVLHDRIYPPDPLSSRLTFNFSDSYKMSRKNNKRVTLSLTHVGNPSALYD